MSQPPYPPYGQDPNRPQDTPRNFPTYGRPPQPAQPPPPPPTYPPTNYPPAGYPPAYGPQPPAYGYGYGYGYPGTPQNKTNGLAIAALVTGLVGILFGLAGPVAVGLGIAALVQIRRRQESGTAQAVVGLVLGSLQIVFWTAFLVIVIAVGSDDEYAGGGPGPTSYSTPSTYVDELAVGECFDDGEEEDEVVRVPCAQPHDGELVSNVTLPAGPFPGDVKVRNAAEASCDKEFSKYVGITVDKSELEPGFWYPDEEYWDDDDRLVICAAYGPDSEKLTGSVKGTKR